MSHVDKNTINGPQIFHIWYLKRYMGFKILIQYTLWYMIGQRVHILAVYSKKIIVIFEKFYCINFMLLSLFVEFISPIQMSHCTQRKTFTR